MAEKMDFAQDRDHNTSMREHVDANDESTLARDHGYPQTHFHRGTNAKKDREDEVADSQEKRGNDGQPQEHADFAEVSQDVVKSQQDSLPQSQSEEELKTRSLATFYKRYRLFVHLFIWLVFTG